MIKKLTSFIEKIQRKLRHRKLDTDIFNNIFDNPNEKNNFFTELTDTGLIADLNEALEQFNAIKDQYVRGQKIGSGVIDSDEGFALFALIRKTKPDIVVETGVCSGYSTAMILKAMELNNKGLLYSVDFPEILGEEYNADDFWEGKGNAVVPQGRESGWLVPEELKSRWHLHLGKSQDLLEPLFKELGEIDIFIHDSEHSYECMSYEYNSSWEYIKDSGYLISDDTGWNSAFFDFAEQKSRSTGLITGNMGILLKSN